LAALSRFIPNVHVAPRDELVFDTIEKVLIRRVPREGKFTVDVGE
jgi:hypothetical protein